MLPFRASRKRHGRLLRTQVQGTGANKRNLGFFEGVVSQSVDFLKLTWPNELGQLNWRVRDVPAMAEQSEEVARYSVNQSRFEITIYRIPIERFTHHRRADRLDERFHIEQYVFQAAAELLGKDPGDLIPEKYKD